VGSPKRVIFVIFGKNLTFMKVIHFRVIIKAPMRIGAIPKTCRKLGISPKKTYENATVKIGINVTRALSLVMEI